MNFRTEVTPLLTDFSIELKDKILLLGSCFSQNIGNKLINARVDTLINPHGIVFNPLSIIKCIEDYISNKEYSSEDLIYENNEFISLNHHGSFRNKDEGILLKEINDRIAEGHQFLKESNLLILTLGTSWTYFYLESKTPVANCHKLPNSSFDKKLVKSFDIIPYFAEILDQLNKFNPELKVIFTVSPVRHWKDGVEENNNSKSHLNILCHEMVSAFDFTYYFPSYEIIMDDLRDYRFYKDDMLHPSSIAINYIWKKFQETYFDNKTQENISKIEKLSKVFNHKAKNEENHKEQIRIAEQKIMKLIKK